MTQVLPRCQPDERVMLFAVQARRRAAKGFHRAGSRWAVLFANPPCCSLATPPPRAGLLEGRKGFNWVLMLRFFVGWVVTLVLAGLTSGGLVGGLQGEVVGSLLQRGCLRWAAARCTLFVLQAALPPRSIAAASGKPAPLSSPSLSPPASLPAPPPASRSPVHGPQHIRPKQQQQLHRPNCSHYPSRPFDRPSRSPVHGARHLRPQQQLCVAPRVHG